ncbi:MAG TPA: invasin domain 3-containing protein, partial [Gemmatimonadales bacterium]|nr:invasin domain 3-containing protein [Gemmatimonadales bacterium]
TPAQAADPDHGIREFVAGTGGGSLYNDQGTPLPNSERFNGTASGVLKLTLGSGTYAWQFIPVAGQTFTDAGSGACHAAPSTVSAAPATIQASTGSTVATITVTARDQSGNPLSGATVVLSATGSGNTLSQPVGATDLSGVATGTLSSTVAGGKTVSATINGAAIAQTATVTVTPAAASALAFTVQPTSAATAARISPAVQVEVRDVVGNRVSSATTVAMAIGTNPAGGTLLGTKAVGAVAGVATFSDLAIDVAGTGYTLRASSGTLTGATSTAFDIRASSVSGSLSTVNAAPTTIAAGVGAATVTVTVKDASGAPVRAATVVLAATGSGNTLTQPAGPTDANGMTTGTLSSTVPETKTVSATANGTVITQTATVTVTASSPPGAISQTLLTVGTNIVNQTVYTTASIAPAANTLITVTVLEHNATSAPPSPTLSGGGMTTWTEVASVTFDVLSTPHRRLTIFRAMSAAPGSGPITITSSVAVSHCQWIVSQWAGVETGGVNGIGAIVQTGSSRGDLVNGLTVPLAAFGNANNVAYGAFAVNRNVAVIAPGAGFTEIAEQPSGENTPGDVEAELAVNRNEIGATWTNLNGGALGVEIRGAAGSGSGVDPALSTVVASPASLGAGGETATITVTVKDGSGAPVSGATVVLAATGAGNTLTQPAGLTDGNGVATGMLRSTGAGTKTVSATASGTLLSQTAAVTVTAGPVSAAQSTVAASPSSFQAGSGSSTITVTAQDGFGNPLSGATVVLAATGNGNTLTQPAGPTDANGVATGTLSSTVAEPKTVSATAGGTAITQAATVTVTTDAPATITQTLLTAGTNTVNQKIYTTADIAPAPNTLITIAVLEHNATSAPPSPTLSGGGMTTWTEVASITFDTGTLPLRRLTIFRAMSAAPGSGPITIASSVTLSHCQWIVSQWDGVETSGVNGAGAIGETGSSRGDVVTGLSVPLGAFGSGHNVGYGAFGVNRNVAVVAPGAGFTEIAEQPSGESTPGDLQAEWGTNDNSIDATWPLNLNAGALGVEIKARTGP